MYLKKIYPIVLFLLLVSSAMAQSNFNKKDIVKDLKIFADPLATKLRDDIKLNAIEKIKTPEIKSVAKKLLKNEYDLTYRYATYKPLLSTEELGKELGIGNGYSKYENVTGIYLAKGRHIVLADGIPDGIEVSLWVANWNRRAPEGVSPNKDPNGWGIKKETFLLTNGVNIIDLKEFDGLAYIHYYSDNPQNKPPVSVHFLNAQINGYFDISKHNNEDWVRLLDHAVYPIIDGLGKHIQVVYPIEDLKKYTKNKGVELIHNYDMLLMNQFRIIGFEKYDKIPENRILSRVNYNYYMFRDGDGVAYMGTTPGYALNRVLDPELIITSGACWGFAHEVGHVHQHINYFNWAGMGEVSNNISTMYVTMAVGHKSNLTSKGYYEKAKTEIIDSAKSFLLIDDFLTRLVPFWQLHIYFESIGNPDFYADMHENFRKQALHREIDNPSRNPAIYQLNFVKKACEIGKTDLIDFFEMYGFFKIGEFNVKDYRSAEYVMTQKMVDDCKAEIRKMNLPKPAIDLTLLTD